jgi:hypothetical protein
MSSPGGHAICAVNRKKKKASVFQHWPSDLVRLAGFEPTTPWFVAKYSIQLSYSRTTLIVRRYRRGSNVLIFLLVF